MKQRATGSCRRIAKTMTRRRGHWRTAVCYYCSIYECLVSSIYGWILALIYLSLLLNPIILSQLLVRCQQWVVSHRCVTAQTYIRKRELKSSDGNRVVFINVLYSLPARAWKCNIRGSGAEWCMTRFYELLRALPFISFIVLSVNYSL